MYIYLYMYIVYNMYVYVIAHMQKSIHLKTAQVGQFLYWKTIQGHSKPLGLMGRVRFYLFRSYFAGFWSPQNQMNKASNIMGPLLRLFCLPRVRSIFIFELLVVDLQTALAPLGFEWPLPTTLFWEFGVDFSGHSDKGSYPYVDRFPHRDHYTYTYKCILPSGL